MGQFIIANERAGPVILRDQFRHVPAQGGAALGGAKRVGPAMTFVPLLDLRPAGLEARQPGLSGWSSCAATKRFSMAPS